MGALCRAKPGLGVGSGGHRLGYAGMNRSQGERPATSKSRHLVRELRDHGDDGPGARRIVRHVLWAVPFGSSGPEPYPPSLRRRRMASKGPTGPAHRHGELCFTAW